MDTWAATEMIIQGVEEKLHAWFQGWKGKGKNGREKGEMDQWGKVGNKNYLRKRHF